MMDLSFWLDNHMSTLYPKLEFQSLLWWICLFDTIVVDKNWRSRYVSILVMMDLSFWPWFLVGYWSPIEVGFNPCYDGFVFLTPKWCPLTSYTIRFNPCYDGFVFLTLSLTYCFVLYLMFQSLLWWICLFDWLS